MYKITKKSHIIEELELANEQGETEYTLKVDIVPDLFRNRYLKAVESVQAANNLPDNVSIEEKGEAARKAILGLFNVVFGEEQTKDLLTFYGGRLTEALTDIMPFITTVVLPRVHEAVGAEKQRLNELMHK